MPIYLAHGFRWPRDGFTGIRVHAIINDLEDVSAEYIQNENSRSALLDCFRSKHPTIMAELEKPGRAIDFLEQYDPDDESVSTTIQPWAFVCDRIVMIAGGENANYYADKLLQKGGMRMTPGEVKKRERKKTLPMTIAAPFTSPASIHALSINVDDVRAEGTGASPEGWHAFQELRDQIAEGETIGWWVVYNGDPDRAYDEEEDRGAEKATPSASPTKQSAPKSPTGGRIPPPIPPSSISKTQRSSTQSTVTSSTSATTPSTEKPTPDPAGAAPADASRSRTGSKSQGLKKLFGKRS